MYVVLGGSGFLGQYIIKNILEITNENIISTYSTNCPLNSSNRISWIQSDIREYDKLEKIISELPSGYKVVYLAAYHHPDKVEQNKKLAWDINIIALSHIINMFEKSKCIYYASTDSVYGNGDVSIPFCESDPTNPVNLYGKHKALAEQIVLAYGGNIIRYPFIFGKSIVPNKLHFFDQIYTELLNGQEIQMFNDSYRSTIDFNQAGQLLIKLIEKYGACQDKIINISSDEILSKYDVAIMLADKYKLNKDLIKPISITSNKIFSVPRAKTTVISNNKIKKLLNIDKITLQL